MRQIENQRMSSQERVKNNIASIREEIQSVNIEIAKIEAMLEMKTLSEPKKKELNEELEELRLDHADLCVDLAMLEELLEQMLVVDDRVSYQDEGNAGVDWNESGYFD